MDTCLWTNKDLKVHLKLSVKLGSGAEPPRNNVAVLSSEGDGEEASRAHRPLPVCLLASKVIPEYKTGLVDHEVQYTPGSIGLKSQVGDQTLIWILCVWLPRSPCFNVQLFGCIEVVKVRHWRRCNFTPIIHHLKQDVRRLFVISNTNTLCTSIHLYPIQWRYLPPVSHSRNIAGESFCCV